MENKKLLTVTVLALLITVGAIVNLSKVFTTQVQAQVTAPSVQAVVETTQTSSQYVEDLKQVDGEIPDSQENNEVKNINQDKSETSSDIAD